MSNTQLYRVIYYSSEQNRLDDIFTIKSFSNMDDAIGMFDACIGNHMGKVYFLHPDMDTPEDITIKNQDNG